MGCRDSLETVTHRAIGVGSGAIIEGITKGNLTDDTKILERQNFSDSTGTEVFFFFFLGMKICFIFTKLKKKERKKNKH